MNKKIVLFTFISLFLLSAIFFHKPIVAVGPDPPATTICVDPPTCTAVVGQTFMINISISNVNDLYGWEFKLGWNRTLLNATKVIEGPFLKSGGDTFFVYMVNTEGYILADCTLLGNILGVSGNGTLATVEFYVECEGESTLDLYDTKLVSSKEESILHEAIDGVARGVMNAHFTLVTLYVVNLYVNETFDQGSSLKVRFHSYSGVYQGEVTVWNGTTPAHVILSEDVPHPLGLPVEKVTLVLTDEFGTILQTVTSFVVHRPDLMGRLGELDYLWTVPGADRPTIMKEYVAIDGQWPYAP